MIHLHRFEDMLGDLDEAQAFRRARHAPLGDWLRTWHEAADLALIFLVHRLLEALPGMPRGLPWPELTGSFRGLRSQPLVALAAMPALAAGIDIATTGCALVDSVPSRVGT